MEHTWQIIRTQEEFGAWRFTIDTRKPIAVDTETRGTRPGPNTYLLGTAITAHLKDSDSLTSIYALPDIELGPFLISCYKFVGWNVPFDKTWLDYHYKVNTRWYADGRILWHLQNNDPTIRGFGLKLAQKKLLGWSESNDKELEENVKAKGGKLSNGDHYLADLHVLSKYACLDAYSTLLCSERLVPFMDSNKYWDFGHSILSYSITLKKAADQGLPVSEADLFKAANLYKHKREIAGQQLRSVCETEVTAIEAAWREQKASTYKSDRGKQRYLNSPSLQRQFNPASGVQRALLLHTMLEFPVVERTPTHLPKTDRSNIGLIKHPSAAALLAYSEYKKVAEQADTYLKHIVDGRLYTNYDVCGTVSGRLSGFKPSVLNMPFSESEVMSAFICDDGYNGIHADLAAIEPCVLAHYSEDPTLAKVYKQGLGDIYLDLALDIFPENAELKEFYDPNAPVTSAIKERFKDLRAVCKTIHLAVSYTGTYITVAKNLTKSGYPTSKGEAMQLVKRYWQKFAKVKAFERRLIEVYESGRTQIRNITGRIIQVPAIYKKDLMNRLVQSSAHDILRLWVMRIIELFVERGIDYRFSLIDLHDSTTFQVKESQQELARQAYVDALIYVERLVGLSVPLKMEFKIVKNLAGIKGE